VVVDPLTRRLLELDLAVRNLGIETVRNLVIETVRNRPKPPRNRIESGVKPNYLIERNPRSRSPKGTAQVSLLAPFTQHELLPLRVLLPGGAGPERAVPARPRVVFNVQALSPDGTCMRLLTGRRVGDTAGGASVFIFLAVLILQCAGVSRIG
jgi:hypothetical protein